MRRSLLRWSLDTCRPVAVCLAFACCVVIYVSQQVRITEASYCLRRLERTRSALQAEQADLAAWVERLRAPERVEAAAAGLRPAEHWQLVSLPEPVVEEGAVSEPLRREHGVDRLLAVLVASPAVAQEAR